MSRAVECVRGFRGKRVLVLGDVMLDAYYLGTARRLAAEAPVPVLVGQRRAYVPGGAANVAVNARSLGANVALVAVVGRDEAGKLLRGALAEGGVATSHLVEDETRRSVQKLRVIGDGQCLVRFDEGDSSEIVGQAEQDLLARLRASYQWADAVIVSDYLAGTITPRVIAEIEALTREQAKLVIVDSKNLKQFRQCNLSVITPNYLEAQQALDIRLRAEALRDMRDLELVGHQLLEEMRTRWAIVTMGEEGAVLFDRDQSRDQSVRRIRPRPVHNPQVVGAGDTFTTALALALAADADIHLACEIAAEAAAIAVGKPGTAAVSQQELLQRLGSSATTTKARDLLPVVAAYHRDGKRIVFTNGCFDILHSGHIAYLREAKGYGDVLVVGVNSDASVRRLKGPTRPINGERDRLAVVAAIDGVDHAVLFDDDTPERLIREIRPHVHVKGGDYRIEDLPEAAAVREVGGEVVIVPLVEGKSSTAIIEKAAGLKERSAGA